MYSFSIPVSILTNVPSENLIIPCYFCQAKIFKIPFSHRPEGRFTAHQLTFHIQLEAVHYWQHKNTYEKSPYSPLDHATSVEASSASFFPHLAQSWYSQIEFIASHVSDSSLLRFHDCQMPNFIYSTPMLRR